MLSRIVSVIFYFSLSLVESLRKDAHYQHKLGGNSAWAQTIAGMFSYQIYSLIYVSYPPHINEMDKKSYRSLLGTLQKVYHVPERQ